MLAGSMNTLNERLNPAATAVAVLVVVLWGFNSVSIKIALKVLPPLLTAGIRFLLSLPVIGLWAYFRRISLRFDLQEMTKLLRLTALFVIQILLLYTGTGLTLASRSTLFISTYPLFTAVFAHYLIGGDRLSGFKIAGMVLAFCGVVLIFAEGIALGRLGTLAGDAMVLASGLVVGFRLVYTKKLIQGIPPVRLVFWQALLSIPVWFVLSAALERPSSLQLLLRPAILTALLYQGLVVAGFCFLAWTTLLRRHSASGLAVFAFISPVSGVAASSLLLAEPVSPALLTSVALIAAGIALVNRRPAPRSGLPGGPTGKKKGFPEGISGKPR
jgi:drug/metabolite transporter (DMT)-like permease